MKVVFKPTPDIISTCDLIDSGISRFLNSLQNEHFGSYEFEVECLININHSIRIFESITELARKDLVYIQSALILARALFETLVKVSWILHPPDIFDSESRYVAQLSTECEFWKKWMKEHQKLALPTDRQRRIFESISKFKSDLSSLLKEKGHDIPGFPNLREMLISLGEERKYLNYILLSQYSHATHYTGSIYRKNLGVEKVLTEDVKLDDWRYVFAVCWPVFELATELYMLRSEGRSEIFNHEFKQAIRENFLKI